MIHPFLRSVGFSGCTDRKQLNALLADVIANPTFTQKTTGDDGRRLGLFAKDYSPASLCRAGIAVFGEYDENDNFIFEYYYPYLRNTRGISTEDISLEKATMQEYLEGITDEPKLGVSLIFFVVNMIECIQLAYKNKEVLKKIAVAFVGFADSGTILMPIYKTQKEFGLVEKKIKERQALITDAKKGNEQAIENLTLEEMDTYTAVSKKIKDNDIFTLVDTYFMPNGVECDHYSVLGTIIQVSYIANEKSTETIVIMRLLCNGVHFDVCLNKADLKGEPEAGRRFKGNIWMTGRLVFKDHDFDSQFF